VDGVSGLGDRLRDEAERHVPDTERIRDRLDVPGRARRHVLVLSTAAATAVLVAGTGVLAARLGDRAAPPATPVVGSPAEDTRPVPSPAPGPGTATSPPAPGTASPDPDPAGELTAPGRTVPHTPLARTTGARSPAAGSPDPPAGAAPYVDLQLRQVPAGTPVVLGPGFTDWAAGPAGKATGTALEVSGGTAGVPGPYRVSWTGGAPQATGTATTGWASGGRIRVRVAAAPGRRTLQLHVGTDGADVTAEVHLGAERRTVTLSAPAPAGVVTVTAESAADPLVVDLIPRTVTPGGRYTLAAVTLGPQ
jgi:hypothetical protein